MAEPVICFGQQPCGFFPKRFLVSKINTARALQEKIGGRIVFFYHDSDHDYRETITVMRDRQTNELARLNFTQDNKIQKKFSPLYAKRIPPGWKAEILKQLPRFMDKEKIKIFEEAAGDTVADFCLSMYQKLGLLKGIEVIRSGDPVQRERAIDLEEDFYADVTYEREIVRARWQKGKLTLHEGGDRYINLPKQEIAKRQKNPGRDKRFAWMQSLIHCTHYIIGAGEASYLDKAHNPEVTFVKREEINEPDLAWI